MRLSRLFYITSLLLVISSVACNQKQSSDTTLTTITLNDNNKISYSEIIDSYRFVRLGTTKTPVGEIEKTIISDKYIILVDAEQAKAIFVFNHEGKAVSEICRLGRGPQEYTFINDVALLNYKGQEVIAVADSWQEKLLLYTIGGEYITSTEYNFYFEQLVQCGKSWLCTTCGDNESSEAFKERDDTKSLLIFADEEMKIKSCALPSPFVREDFATPEIVTNGDMVSIMPKFQDTLYRVADGQISPAYRFDISAFGGVTHTDDWSTDELIKNFNNLVHIYGVQEANNHIIVEVAKKEFIDIYIYNKLSGKAYRIKNGKEITSLADFVSDETCAAYKDEFVAIADAYTVADYNKKYPDKAVFNGITEEENPVIVFYTLKL